LLVHLPLRYEDETRITPVDCAFGGEPVQVEVVVHSNELQFRPRRQMVVRAGTARRDHAALFQLLPQPAGGAERRLAHPGLWRGARRLLRRRDGASALSQGGDDEPLPRNDADLPVDRRTGQFGPAKADRQGAGVGDLSDTLPDDCASAETARPGAQPPLPAHPPPGTDLDTLHARNHPAWRRVKFDEVLAQQLSLRRAYLARREQGAPVLVARDDLGARCSTACPSA
jgi:ATP-dependent DNA helicase RecG